MKSLRLQPLLAGLLGYFLATATGLGLETQVVQWYLPTKVSNSSGGDPENTHLAIDSFGVAHIVCNEQINGTRPILYSHCLCKSCLAPEAISDGACSEQAASSDNR
jgi:hypothetical protein